MSQDLANLSCFSQGSLPTASHIEPHRSHDEMDVLLYSTPDIRPPCLEDFELKEESRAEVKRLWKEWIVRSKVYTPKQLLQQPEYCVFKELQRRLFEYERALTDFPNKLRRRKESYWYSLSGWDFETEIGRLFGQFNYDVVVTKGSGDGGVDIQLSTAANLRWVVQCKNHRKPVGPAVVRELYGVCVHECVSGGVLVASGGFTSGARTFADDKPITLVDMPMILAMEAGKEVILNR